MALTPQELDIAKQIQAQGGTVEDFREVLSQLRSQSSQSPVEEPMADSQPQDTMSQNKGPLAGISKSAPVEAPVESYGDQATASISEQFSPRGLIGGGVQRADEAGSDFAKGNIFKGAAKTVESGLQIAGGALSEGLNQGLIAAGNLYKTGLEQLDTETLATLNAISSAPVEQAAKILNGPAGKAIAVKLGQIKDSIPENYRRDAEAILNLIPGKMATKDISLTQKGATRAAAKLATKAESLATKIIQPTKYDTLAATALADKAVKVKTYKELTNVLEAEQRKVGSQLETALGEVAGNIKDDRLSNTLEFVFADATKNPALNKLTGVSDSNKEIQRLLDKSRIDGLTLPEVQKAKRLIDERFSIYKRSGDVAGGEMAVAMDKERKYIKELIESAAPDVKKLNQSYEGLREAAESAAEQARKFGNDTTPKPGFLNDQVLARITKITGGEWTASSKIQRSSAELAKKTAELEKTTKRAKTQKSIQEMLGLPSPTGPQIFKVPGGVEKQKFVLPGQNFSPVKSLEGGFSPAKKAPVDIKSEITKAKAEKIKLIPKKK